MNITLVNEVGLADDQMKTILLALNSHAKKVAEKYNLAPVALAIGAVINGPTILITERLPKWYVVQPGTTRPQGLRYVENGQPIVYVSLRGSSKLFGRYMKPWVLRGVTKRSAIMTSGTITVLAHELTEMLVAPMLDQFTLPDNAGKMWRKEACDPVLGSYYFENVNGQDCVFPDFVLPSFWDVNGKSPFSYNGSKVGPLVWASKTYGWFRTQIRGMLTKVTF